MFLYTLYGLLNSGGGEKKKTNKKKQAMITMLLKRFKMHVKLQKLKYFAKVFVLVVLYYNPD